MSYTFQPMTEAELEAMSLVPEGIYDFEVLKSTRKISKSGNDMAELQLGIYDQEGRIRSIFDYLVFSSVNLNIKKISHFCKASGLAEEYIKGSLPEDLSGRCGKVNIGVQEERPKEAGGFYPKKNIVLDYIFNKEGQVKSTSDKDDFKSDDVPF